MNKDKPLTMEDLQKVMDSLIPEFNSQDIDDFVAKGNKIENIVLMTMLDSMKNVPKLRTKHGILKVQYNRHLPNNSNFLMRIPESFLYGEKW